MLICEKSKLDNRIMKEWWLTRTVFFLSSCFHFLSFFMFLFSFFLHVFIFFLSSCFIFSLLILFFFIGERKKGLFCSLRKVLGYHRLLSTQEGNLHHNMFPVYRPFVSIDVKNEDNFPQMYQRLSILNKEILFLSKQFDYFQNIKNN